MTAPPLVNPGGTLLPEIQSRLFLARKTKPLWAKQVTQAQEVESLEGRQTMQAGDYLCRGVHDEQWPQSAGKLHEKYTASGQFDADRWQRFDPKPDAAPVQAAQLDTAFRVIAQWGELAGKANDYVVRSTTDPADIWVVDQAIFDASYSRDSGSSDKDSREVDSRNKDAT